MKLTHSQAHSPKLKPSHRLSHVCSLHKPRLIGIWPFVYFCHDIVTLQVGPGNRVSSEDYVDDFGYCEPACRGEVPHPASLHNLARDNRSTVLMSHWSRLFETIMSLVTGQSGTRTSTTWGPTRTDCVTRTTLRPGPTPTSSAECTSWSAKATRESTTGTCYSDLSHHSKDHNSENSNNMSFWCYFKLQWVFNGIYLIQLLYIHTYK